MALETSFDNRVIVSSFLDQGGSDPQRFRVGIQVLERARIGERAHKDGVGNLGIDFGRVIGEQ